MLLPKRQSPWRDAWSADLCRFSGRIMERRELCGHVVLTEVRRMDGKDRHSSAGRVVEDRSGRWLSACCSRQSATRRDAWFQSYVMTMLSGIRDLANIADVTAVHACYRGGHGPSALLHSVMMLSKLQA